MYFIKTHTRKAKFAELKPYDRHAKEHDFMEICEWSNDEGFDFCINNRQFQLTWGQWECLQVLVNYKD
jgi:hypothetical protein